MSRTGWILGVLLLSIGIAQEAQARPTRWQDVKSWERLGYRWVLGRDAQGEPLAIYDVSYPEVNHDIPIGRVGSAPQGPEVKEAIEAWAIEEGASSRQVESLVHHWDRANDGARVVFEPEWWKGVPWRPESRFAWQKDRDSEPEAFRLSEVAFENWVHFSKRQKTYDALEKVEEFADRVFRGLDDTERPSWHFDTLQEALQGGLLNWVEFRKVPNKNHSEYEIWWVSPGPEILPSTPWDFMGVTRPAKIVDFWSQKEGLIVVLLMEAMQFAANQLVGQIPVPALRSLLALTMGRILRFTNEIRTVRQSMFLEMIDHAQDVADELIDDPSAPFLRLDEYERFWSMTYVYYARSNWTSAVEWIFRKPGQYWPKDRWQAQSRTDRIVEQYAQQDAPLERLGLRFAYDPEARRLLLAGRPPHRDGTAYVGVDFQAPYRIRTRRALMLAASIIAEYSLSFIPWVGGLLHSLYGELIDKPIRISGVWEARMEAHLEHRADRERWDRALRLLSDQRVNPFELSREGQDRLISLRLEALGISR